MRNKIIIVCGATASGKSAYAIELAQKLDGVILNGDSMQIYKELPILTSQPSQKDKQKVPHEFYGFLECDIHFSVGRWLELIVPRIKQILGSAKTPIIVGGTGLYLKSLIDGFVRIPEISSETKKFILELDQTLTNEEIHAMLEAYDPNLYSKLKINDRKRALRAIAVSHETGISLSWWQENNQQQFFEKADFYSILINPSRETIYQNCNQRFLKMLDTGALDEARALIHNFPDIKYPEAIGLKQLISHIKKEIPLEEAIKKAQQLTRNYAKRQITWFKHQMTYDLIKNN